MQISEKMTKGMVIPFKVIFLSLPSNKGEIDEMVLKPCRSIGVVARQFCG